MSGMGRGFYAWVGALALAGTGFAAESQAAEKSFYFKLTASDKCPSGYAADNRLTPQKREQICVAFDLSGQEASAFQGGIGLYEQPNGTYREVWPLGDIWFSLDPRELPNPAVSPLIYFRFEKDSGCPSAYAGHLLEYPNREAGCLIFDLSGSEGKAKVLATGQREWLLKDLVFRVPKH